jgi:hypothetical protein
VGITETTATACIVCAASRVAVGTTVSPADVCAASRVAVGTAVSPADVCAASRVAVGTGVSPGAAGVASSVAVGIGVAPCVAGWAGVFPGFRKAHPAINTNAITMRTQVPVPMYIRFMAYSPDTIYKIKPYTGFSFFQMMPKGHFPIIPSDTL